MGLRLPRDVEARVMGLAAGGGQRCPPPWSITIGPLPIKVVSELNRRDHWAQRKRRFDTQRQSLQDALGAAFPPGLMSGLVCPVVVTLTRVGTRSMDSDNLAGGFKAIRDELARCLGVDDGDETRVRWEYSQEGGRPGCPQGIIVTIRGGSPQ